MVFSFFLFDQLFSFLSFLLSYFLNCVDCIFLSADMLMRSASSVPSDRPIKKTKDIAKLIKEMKRLTIKKRITTLIKSRKKLVRAKVNLDPETIKEWEILMVSDLPNISSADKDADKETESKWKGEREMFQSRIDLFINRMHLLQGTLYQIVIKILFTSLMLSITIM